MLDDSKGRRSLADPLTGAPVMLSRDEIVAAARRAMPGAALISVRQLDEPDAYWYTLHHERELPVLRIGFDDPAQTWLHISPVSAEILDRSDDSRRSYRWLFQRAAQPRFPAAAALLAGARCRGLAAVGDRHDRLDQRHPDRLAPVTSAQVRPVRSAPTAIERHVSSVSR